MISTMTGAPLCKSWPFIPNWLISVVPVIGLIQVCFFIIHPHLHPHTSSGSKTPYLMLTNQLYRYVGGTTGLSTHHVQRWAVYIMAIDNNHESLCRSEMGVSTTMNQRHKCHCGPLLKHLSFLATPWQRCPRNCTTLPPTQRSLLSM